MQYTQRSIKVWLIINENTDNIGKSTDGLDVAVNRHGLEIVMIKILKDLTNKADNMHKDIGNIRRNGNYK